jgi:RNA polymerase primary sigma factor
LGDFIEDKGALAPSDAVVGMDLKEQTRQVLSTLTYREEKVLRMRFGIGESNGSVHAESGAEKDIDATREKIMQLESSALHILRKADQGKKLKAFLNEKS